MMDLPSLAGSLYT